jgi:hypothetical protein
LGAAILHNPAENYQMFTSDDMFITQRIEMKQRSGAGLTTKRSEITVLGR